MKGKFWRVFLTLSHAALISSLRVGQGNSPGQGIMTFFFIIIFWRREVDKCSSHNRHRCLSASQTTSSKVIVIVVMMVTMTMMCRLQLCIWWWGQTMRQTMGRNRRKNMISLPTDRTLVGSNCPISQCKSHTYMQVVIGSKWLVNEHCTLRMCVLSVRNCITHGFSTRSRGHGKVLWQVW